MSIWTMKRNSSLGRTLGAVLLLTLSGDFGLLQAQRMRVPQTEEIKQLPTLASKLPESWLAPGEHPRLAVGRERLSEVRRRVAGDPVARRYLEKQRKIAASFRERSAEELRALVPPPKSDYIYGLGMNLDPIRGRPLAWAGWDAPFTMLDEQGRSYPNDEWPAKGKDAEGARFLAAAHGAILRELEEKVLPALADLYALEKDEAAARAAAYLLDAIAEAYRSHRRGPLDYPIPAGLEEYGGRLNRAHYMVARGLANYVTVIDLIAASGALEQPSAYLRNGKIREQLIRHLLWDGGVYCLTFARQSTLPDNGTMDWLRGSACVGVLLKVPELFDPLISGPFNLYRMVGNNIDRNGFYFESAPGYESYTRSLYLDLAELIEAARNSGFTQAPSVYSLPEMQAFLHAPFDRREISGKLPLTGDSALDRATVDPRRRLPEAKRVYTDAFLDDQIVASWKQLVRADRKEARQEAAKLLSALPVTTGQAQEPAGGWAVYHVEDKHLLQVNDAKAGTAQNEEPQSALYGAKGLALLRAGKGEKRYGAQLFFGPLHSHAQAEALTWMFFSEGSEWSMDPGRFNTHLRMGWTRHSVAHQAVLIDGQSHAFQGGGGVLTAWLPGSGVSWAVASHQIPDAAGAMHPLHRAIGQVHDEENGGLLYWIDVAHISGDEMRDDSFHSLAQELICPLTLTPTGEAALYGETDYGRALRNDGKLKNAKDKGFYWEAPGQGYGFLGAPRLSPLLEGVRLRMPDPSRGTLVADLDGAPDRELIVADGPGTSRLPSVPYIIRRDRGTGGSFFAKVLSFERNGNSPVTAPLRRLTGSGGAIWRVDLAGGHYDIWIYNEEGAATALQEEAMPRLETDARMACFRFQSDGGLRELYATGATFVKAGEQLKLTSPGKLEGRIESIDSEGQEARLAFRVHWSAEAFARWEEGVRQGLFSASMGTSRLAQEPAGTWSITSLTAQQVILEDTKASLGQVRLTPVNGKRGEMKADVLPGRLWAPHRLVNYAYAQDRPILQNGTVVATLGKVSDEGTLLTLKPANRSLLPTQEGDYDIAEVAPGATFSVPVNLIWRAEKPHPNSLQNL